MKKISLFLKRKSVFISAIALFVIGFISQKIVSYSADPQGEKDCPPQNNGEEKISTELKTETGELYIQLPWSQHGGNINDASCLNRTEIFGVVEIKKEEDIVKALQYAREKKINISIAGVKHSMGGQAFAKNAIVLDMRKFKNIEVNEKKETMLVQSGATWHDIQNILHPKFSVKAMQSTDIFTVGGSIAVNAHGMDHQSGSIERTLRSMRVLLADGTIKKVSRTENSELFKLIVGGYGLFGIVLDAELDITPNVVYETKRKIMDYKEFPDMFKKTISPDPKYGLTYSHLSTSPSSFLKEMILYTYEKSNEKDVIIGPLTEVSNVKLRRFVLNFSKHGSIPMRIKWFTEKYIEPKLESCTVNRNQALKEGESCLVSRNDPMHDSVAYLKNNIKSETDILHEYFIPRKELVPFIDDMREVLKKNNANLLNASIRVVHKGENFLTYAPTDMFSIVLYINQQTNTKGNLHMQKLTKELIDITHKHNGRFFLPYQLHYTPEQLKNSYPEIGSFFSLKKKYDPSEVFTNTFYKKYSPYFKS